MPVRATRVRAPALPAAHGGARGRNALEPDPAAKNLALGTSTALRMKSKAGKASIKDVATLAGVSLGSALCA